MGRWLTHLVAVCGICWACVGISPAHATEEASAIAFYLGQSEPMSGLKLTKIDERQDPIYLQPRPVATRDDVSEVRAINDDGRPALEIVFTDAGAKKIAAATSENLGKWMAILVDDKVIAAPIIRSKIEKRAHVTSQFSDEEVRCLAERVNSARPKSP